MFAMAVETRDELVTKILIGETRKPPEDGVRHSGFDALKAKRRKIERATHPIAI
jgi:hypothetical protein